MNEERFVSEGFELLIRLPGRTRVPRNWMIVTEGCEQRSASTPHGMMLTVRSPLEAEIDRVFDALLKQPWAGEIADTWSRSYKILEILTPRPERVIPPAGGVTISLPFHVARGVTPPVHEPQLLECDVRYVSGYNDQEEDDGA